MKICLYCGHGGTPFDPGACGNGYREADLTRQLGEALQRFLSPYCDVDLYDTSKNLFSELKAGREKKTIFGAYDYNLELHFNSHTTASAHGTEAYVSPEEKSRGVSVEEKILKNLSKYFSNRGVKTSTSLQNLNICRKYSPEKSYCLLEVCFISNYSNITSYISNFNDIVALIGQGIIDGFGLVKSESAPTFNDVVEADWAYDEITVLSLLGIVKGDGNGNFRPDDFLTRREAAVLIYKLLNKK